MKREYNGNYPSIDDLRTKARKKIPKFAFEYLDGGCNEDVNLHKAAAWVMVSRAILNLDETITKE